MNANNPTIIPDDVHFNSLYLQYLREKKELEEINITNQLNIFRSDQHEKYIASLNLVERNNDIADQNNIRLNDASNNSLRETELTLKKTEWAKSTVLITGDSLVVFGLQEKKMGKNVKVRGFSGASINDLSI